MDTLSIARDLSRAVSQLQFSPPVSHVYNPLDYAWETHRVYLERFGSGAKQVILVGMNPGPFGMAQTGVPFGEISLVRDWMGISGPVGQPEEPHPKRPIEGFACTRSEVSGARLWGWAKKRFVTPEKFFSRFFVYNYCPLAFMEESGRNFTPNKLPAQERKALENCCDVALAQMVDVLEADYVIGVGAFAEQRIRGALDGFEGTIGRVLHPSPASPAANRGWEAAAEADFKKLGILD